MRGEAERPALPFRVYLCQPPSLSGSPVQIALLSAEINNMEGIRLFEAAARLGSLDVRPPDNDPEMEDWSGWELKD